MSLPYFPLYPADYEADTSHLTLVEDGAYNRLLRLMWMSPDCTLPADPAWLTRRMRIDASTYDTVVAPLIAEFFRIEKGRLLNPRLLRIWRESHETHRKRSDAGKKGGRPAKQLEMHETMQSPAKPGPKQPEPEPEPDKKEKKESTPPPTPTAARETEQDRSPVGGLGGGAGQGQDEDFEGLVQDVFRAAGFDLLRRSARTDEHIARWASALPHVAVVRVVEERTRAMRATGDPPRTLKAFDDGMARAIEGRSRGAPPTATVIDIASIVSQALKQRQAGP